MKARAMSPWMLILVAVVSCGGHDGSKPIGSPCGSGSECGPNPENACVVSWPSGYCTEFPCDVASCPAGSQCVRGIQFLNVDQSSFCLATCGSDIECRAGYHCVSISSADKVCAPTGS